MATKYTTSLTGKTVAVTGLVVEGHQAVADFRAEVLSTWFDIKNRVEAVEVRVPGFGRRSVWGGFELVG